MATTDWRSEQRIRRGRWGRWGRGLALLIVVAMWPTGVVALAAEPVVPTAVSVSSGGGPAAADPTTQPATHTPGEPTTDPAAEPPEVVGPAATVGPATAPAETDPQPPSVPGAGDVVPEVAVPSAAPAVVTGAQGSLTAPRTAPPVNGWITSREWYDFVAAGRLTDGAVAPALPVFVSDVTLAATVTSAVWTVAGVGLYTPLVNGRPVSAAVLQPGYTDYSKRVEYRSYDVTALMGQGANRLTMQLGTGMYDSMNLADRYSKLARIGGMVAFTARLDVTLAGGSTTTRDTTAGWLGRPGGTAVADWFGGEDYDARVLDAAWTMPSTTPLGAGTGGWSAAVRAGIPASIVLDGQTGPAVSALDAIVATSVTREAGGNLTIDFGQYVTGFPQFSLSGAVGQTVRLYPAERRGVDGRPDQRSATGASDRPIYDSYTFGAAAGQVLAGADGPETWHPQFVYHGFRYLTVTGYSAATPAKAQFSVITVHADLTRTGTVDTDDATLNAVFAMTGRSIDANLQSVPTDCPNREKLGWLEQSSLMFGLLANRYDMSAYGRSLAKTIAEAQRPDGSVPEIAPELVQFPGPFRNDVWWSNTVVMVPWHLYEYYGDLQTLSAYYANGKRYVSWLESVARDNLISGGLGDWITVESRTDNRLVESMGYLQTVATMARIAALLGQAADAPYYNQLAAAIGAAINRTYYLNGSYGPDQTSNAMALVLGIAPDEGSVRAALLSSFGAAGGHFHLGEIGLPFAVTALSEMGRDDVVYDAIEKSDQTGFAYFTATDEGRRGGLPEYWEGSAGIGSMAHIILGAPALWMMDDLAGISRQPGTVGFRTLLITPAVYTGPARVTASSDFGYGTASVGWTRSGDHATVTVTIPAGGSATVVLPDASHQVGSGTFTFTTGLGTRPSYRSDVVKVPWSDTVWQNVNGRAVPLDWASWAALGYPAPRTALPLGSFVAFDILGPQLLARTSDGQDHPLNYDEWSQLGFPTPARIERVIGKYQWGPTAWITLKWSGNPQSWEVRHLTFEEWGRLGNPGIPDGSVIWGSSVFQYLGSPEVYLTDPSGGLRWLTFADYSYLGYPAFEQRNQAWVLLPGSGKIVFLTDRSAGVGTWADYQQWAAALFPPPQRFAIPGLRWRLAGDGSYEVVLAGGATIPMTVAEYAAAGSPAAD